MLKTNPTLALFCALIFIHAKIASEIVQANLVPIPHSEFVIDHKADQEHLEKILKERAKQRYTEFLSKQDVKLYEEAFNSAPIKIKTIVQAMLNGEEFTQEYRALLLTGPSGSGKSTLAQAIAYKLRRKFIVIHAPSLLGHYRDKAAENLRDAFRELDEDPDEPILIMDEMNALTDGHTSEHSDTKHTAMQLWTLLDQHRNNKSFMFIGTTNVTKKMPHQLQSRFKGKTFSIDNPSIEVRAQAIRYCIKSLNTSTDDTCTDVYINELAKKTDHFSQRDIKSLITAAILSNATQNGQKSLRVLTKKNLEEAYQEIRKEDEYFWDFQEHMTDEERRHKESIQQNQKQFEKSQELQIQLAEWNMLYQALLKPYDKTAAISWTTAVAELNKSKKLILPDKKPIAQVKTVPAKRWCDADQYLLINTDKETEEEKKA